MQTQPGILVLKTYHYDSLQVYKAHRTIAQGAVQSYTSPFYNQTQVFQT